MRYVVVVMLLIIIGSLASAMVFLMKDKGKSSRTVYALSVRIGLSVVLFLLILFAHQMGWIQSTGIR